MYSFIFRVTVGTIVGTLLAFLIVPMRSLGQDSWKIAAALMGSYIGGGNFLEMFHLVALAYVLLANLAGERGCIYWHIQVCEINCTTVTTDVWYYFNYP